MLGDINDCYGNFLFFFNQKTFKIYFFSYGASSFQQYGETVLTFAFVLQSHLCLVANEFRDILLVRLATLGTSKCGNMI